MPGRDKFAYTFDNLANIVQGFTGVVGFDLFAVYAFDYGAPIGFRLAMRHPERITAIISQNGNAHEEGLSSGWDLIGRTRPRRTATRCAPSSRPRRPDGNILMA
jgi:pimeloyl-ACP methyl ester carboxylesterase